MDRPSDPRLAHVLRLPTSHDGFVRFIEWVGGVTKAPNLPRECKGEARHKLVSREQLTKDYRCRECANARKRAASQKKRLADSPDDRFYRRSLPTWCSNLEHYLERDEDLLKKGTVMCKQCHQAQLRRKGGSREERFVKREEAALAASQKRDEEPQQAQEALLMFKLRGVRNSLGLSTYELASYSRIPHKAYLEIEELERKADTETQYKLTNGVWLAKRQYQRDIAEVAL